MQFDFAPSVAGAEAHDKDNRLFDSSESVTVSPTLYVNAGQWDLNAAGLYSMSVTVAASPAIVDSTTETITVNVEFVEQALQAATHPRKTLRCSKR